MIESDAQGSPTNEWVAQKLGYSPSGASLLRRGHRGATLALMRTVQQQFGWPVKEQVEQPDGTWHTEFENRVRQAWLRENLEAGTNTREQQ